VSILKHPAFSVVPHNMKVLLAGVNGYISTRLIPVLLEKGHEVVCLTRDKEHFHKHEFSNRVTLVAGDLLKESSIEPFPTDVDAAYYLVYSMSQAQDFAALEALSAYNFIHALDKTNCRQTIFLSGIVNNDKLSKHLEPRKHVEGVLKEGKSALTVLRAALIIGAGSASFEIIRDLTEKLSIMTVPRWVNTRCQPIAICDVLGYLESVMLNEKTFNRNFDIGGPDILTFREMMLTYAKVRHLKRRIITIPFLSPKISSYWLHFVTSVSYTLAQSLVNSMKNETIMHDHAIDDIVSRRCLTYEEALQLAFIFNQTNELITNEPINKVN
jgi:uncharacterized protein YbjT (DUF2867 family)